jgi:hypothetical protein
MQIQLTHNGLYYLNGSCGACGESFTPDAIIAIAYSRTGAEVGMICDQCLEAGYHALRQRIQGQATTLRRRAEALERLAEEDILFPERADWQALEIQSSQDTVNGDYLAGLWYQSVHQMVAV